MSNAIDSSPTEYRWLPQPAAANYVLNRIDEVCQTSDWVNSFRDRLLAETGTRLVDWLDHIVVASDDQLKDVGYVQRADGAFEHLKGMFPTIVVLADVTEPVVGIKVESVNDFLAAQHDAIEAVQVEGQLGDQVRIAQVKFHAGGECRIVERHGDRGFVAGNPEHSVAAGAVESALESFRTRNRSYTDSLGAFAEVAAAYQRASEAVGQNRACDLFFQAEREYWQSKNKVAAVQYQRQAVLGLGWANHDHHTYRCSREFFAPLIAVLESMGFQCRERFYAGSDAGWGAQVLEHTQCGIVIFADVDMSEVELAGDFSHEGLSRQDDLGTVGLWCRLHGDSFLAAGMHHLECQFDFDASRAQLAELGFETMAPFTDTPCLKQAFTAGEIWPVPASRLGPLIDVGAISPEDAQRFETVGALGSHMEILERNEGYKGFNQTGISKIILETNPKNAR